MDFTKKKISNGLHRYRIRVFVVDRDKNGLGSLAQELNNDHNHNVWTAEVDVSDWDSQRTAFEAAIDSLGGRIDYVFPIAGVGERRSFPNKPHSNVFEKPDMTVIEIDEIGVIYTVSLAVQHFRRLKANKDGYKGRSESR